jgi:hypothetical protein
MPQPNEKPNYFTDEETPLPLHMKLMEIMPRPKYACRSYTSRSARAAQYECFSFYKHISRVVPLELGQEGDNGASC